MTQQGGYADRAYAGKANTISELYRKLGDQEKSEQWYKEYKKYAKRYNRNPSMSISSLKYCENVSGRMIDNYNELVSLEKRMK